MRQTPPRVWRWLAVGLSTVAWSTAQAGCDVDEARAGGGHAHGAVGGHGGGGHEAGGDGHSGHETAAYSKTVYDSGLELFIEYPPLVVGNEAEFSAHVSTVDGYEPASEGTVAVVLTSESAPGERFESGEPVRGGLYQPVATPQHAGERRLFVSYDGPEGSATFPLGNIEVHQSAPEHPPHGDGSPGGISFSKEQQWKVDFATGKVRRRKLQPSVRAQGFVRPAPDATARLRAPFAGRVLEPEGGMPEVGEQIEAGQTLAVIAPTVDANVVPMLRADLSKAKTRVTRRKREVERLKGLVDRGAVPEKRLLDARSRLRAAEADVRAAEQRLEQYRAFDRGGPGATVPLRAPVAGTVTTRPVTPGEYVEPGEVVLRTVDETRLQLEVRVAEANLPKVDRVGGVWFEGEDGEVVELARTEKRFFARVDRIDPSTRTSSFWFGIPDGRDNLVAGQYHRVHLRTGRPEKALAVPASALVEQKGIWTAYVVHGGESFERRIVQIGTRDGDQVEIVDGLEAGDRLVTRGAYYVKLAAATTGVGSHSH
ncbi:MAG: efflux RND transporter periplasmic adaptor subunit [Bradymonadaceae bacterium]